MVSKALLLGLACLVLVGCKPYDVPEYQEIAPNESGFLVKMQGDSLDEQSKFESVEFLNQNKVAAKRVRIPHTWSQEGRMRWNGKYIDDVRLVKVDRTPQTRFWTASNGQGAPGTNTAIWVESQDSVSLSIDIVCTAMIEEDEAAKFLYLYTSRSLHDVMDKEIRARVQQELADACAAKSLEELKENKGAIMATVRPSITKFFSARGVTITTLGLSGGLTYENGAIQQAIDKTFSDQQLQISAQARYEAQLKENQTIEAKAKAEAEAARLKASGEAEGIKLLADAKAYEIEKARSTGAMYVQLRQLEILAQTMGKWDGKLPVYQMGSNGQTPQLLMMMPPEAVAK